MKPADLRNRMMSCVMYGAYAAMIWKNDTLANKYVDSRKEHSINNVRLISLMDTLSAMESYGKVESNYRLTVNFERVL